LLQSKRSQDVGALPRLSCLCLIDLVPRTVGCAKKRLSCGCLFGDTFFWLASIGLFDYVREEHDSSIICMEGFADGDQSFHDDPGKEEIR